MPPVSGREGEEEGERGTRLVVRNWNQFGDLSSTIKRLEERESSGELRSLRESSRVQEKNSKGELKGRA